MFSTELSLVNCRICCARVRMWFIGLLQLCSGFLQSGISIIRFQDIRFACFEPNLCCLQNPPHVLLSILVKFSLFCAIKQVVIGQLLYLICYLALINPRFWKRLALIFASANSDNLFVINRIRNVLDNRDSVIIVWNRAVILTIRKINIRFSPKSCIQNLWVPAVESIPTLVFDLLPVNLLYRQGKSMVESAGGGYRVCALTLHLQCPTKKATLLPWRGNASWFYFFLRGFIFSTKRI